MAATEVVIPVAGCDCGLTAADSCPHVLQSEWWREILVAAAPLLASFATQDDNSCVRYADSSARVGVSAT